jgi:hypothetical protein
MTSLLIEASKTDGRWKITIVALRVTMGTRGWTRLASGGPSPLAITHRGAKNIKTMWLIMWFGNDETAHCENGGIEERTRSTAPAVSHALFVTEIR